MEDESPGSAAFPREALLRVQASSPFVLHWSNDEWKTVQDTTSTPTSLGIEFVDIQVAAAHRLRRCVFTFYWPQDSNWQGAELSESKLRSATQPA